jgi:hypothetical protein
MTKILIDEALRLADAIQLGWLENVDADKADIDMIQTELRRLRAENEELRQALEQPAPAQEPYGWKVDGYIDLFHCEHEAKSAAKEINSFAFPLYTTPPAPAQPIAQAVQTLIQAMQDDPEYAWSWHCNIAMAFVDAGGDRYTANQGAARFLEMFAKVQPAHELPAPAPAEPDPDELTIAYMSGVYEGKKRKPWVGLTEQEALDCFSPNPVTHSKNVEAKLKEKNT